jgi:hypothetical protein
MTQLQFATDSAPGGALISDDSARASSLVYATNIHGFAELRSSIPMALAESFLRFDRAGLPHQRLNDGAQTVYEGRMEDLAINGDGVQATALGYSRALSDAPYTALWSNTDVTQWRPVRTSELASRTPELYQFDTNNRIQMSLPQGSIYGNNANVGSQIFQKSEGGVRSIIGISFDAIVTLPANWIFFYQTYTSGFVSVASATIDTGIAGTNVINKFYTLGACDYVEFAVINSTGGNYTVNNAPNVWRVSITNIRVVTSLDNRIDTTTTANIVAGAGVSIPVVTTARMYVGQRLHIGIPAANGEGIIVTSITDSTHFVATIAANYASGANVQAHVIYADEVARDLVIKTNALNATQLNSSTALIQSPALDLLNESYQDQYGADILTRLVTLGDNQTTPRQWEWAVWENRQLVYQPRGYSARTWYVDLARPEIERTLNALANSVYADYQEPGGRTLRTTAISDAASIARYGVTRRTMLAVSTTSATQAGIQQAAQLNDTKDPIPRARLTIEAIFDQNGARWPLTSVRANDIIVIRNLPPTLSTTIDRVRILRAIRTEVDVFSGILTIEPESPLPTLAAMLARATAPAWVTSPWWVLVNQK